jgi:hypothetical protein
MSSLYESVHSIRPQTRDPRSRLATININLLREFAESSGLNINPDIFIQRLISNSTRSNRDLGLLILFVNGIIQVEIPNVQEQPLVDKISDHVEEGDKE